MKYLFSLFIVIFSLSTNAQELNYKQGEIIIELDSNDTSLLKSNLSNRGIQNAEISPLTDSSNNVFLIKVDFRTVNVQKLTQELHAESDVVHVQRNRLLELRSTTPNDEFFVDQWQYFNTENQEVDFQIDQAWDITTGGKTPDGKTIVIAIVDNGFDIDHQDLIDNVWINTNEIPDNGIDDDNNGFIDDIYGWNAADNKGDLGSAQSHGTSVAGIIGAKGNNSIGVSGVNWDVKMMLIKGGGTEAEAIASFDYPLQMRKLYNETNGEKGAFVVAINSSWGIDGGKAEESPLWCKFYNTLGEAGILSIAATSNKDVDVEQSGDLPGTCTSDYLLTVTNLLEDEKLKTNAAYGAKSIDIAAYGSSTYTVKVNDNYGSFGGTSAAAPHVTGTVGLIYSADCNISNITNYGDQVRYVKDIILDSAKPLPSLQDIITTSGKLDIGTSVKNAYKACKNDCTPIIGSEIVISDEGFKIEFSGANTTTIKYKELDAEQFTTIENYKSGTLIKNKAYCSTYVAKISNPCSGTEGYNRYFTSGGCCENPEMSATIDEQDNLVIALDIDTTDDSDQFYIDYREKGQEWNTKTITGIESPVTLTKTGKCKIYEYRIKKVCSNFDIDYSQIQKYYSDCSTCGEDYCDYNNLTNEGEYIKKFILGNNIDIDRNQDNKPNDYFFEKEYEITAGSDISMELQIGYSSNIYSENAYIFLDINQDGVFDKNEVIFEKKAFKELANELISIPDLGVYGRTRLRVVMGFGLLAEACKDTNARKYGDIIDVCVNVIPNGSCISAFEPKVSYDKNSEEYLIELNPDGKAEYTIKVNDKTYTTDDIYYIIEDLECGDYVFDISATCNGTTVNNSVSIDLDCSVSTKDNEIQKFSITPNPSRSLNISYKELIDKIVVLNNNGEVIYQGKYTDISNVLPGMYHIIVISKEERYILKWIKL